MSWKDNAYTVGYGKPPTFGQFQKGKSGNPSGRPRGTRNFSSDLEEVLSKKKSQSLKTARREKSVRKWQLCKGSAKKRCRVTLDRSSYTCSLAAEQAHDIDAQNNEQALSASDVQIVKNYFEFLQAQSSTASEQDLEDENDG